MKTTWILGLIGSMFLLMSAGTAGAHGTACCAFKPCPASKTAVPGATPAAARCCTNPASPETCTPAVNAGWRCASLSGSLPSAPTNQAVAGCTGEGACVGGVLDQGGPEGCIGISTAAYVTSSSPTGGTAQQCTIDAVDACCAQGACTTVPE